MSASEESSIDFIDLNALNKSQNVEDNKDDESENNGKKSEVNEN